MYKFSFRLIGLIIMLFICFSCNVQRDNEDSLHLTELDAMIDSIPNQVSDSLKAMSENDFSRENKAYYNLLSTITDDKTYVNFTNDSLINNVVDYYQSHDPKNNNYLRSLIYQGVVRMRMGVIDSTAFEPLKAADYIFQQQINPDPSIGYMINFFLGNIHYKNRNHDMADSYYLHALDFTSLENDSIHYFDTNMALFWNEMSRNNFEKGKYYLDILTDFYGKKINKDYYILNAQSVFYGTQGEFEKALESDKERLNIALLQKDDIDLSRLYFVISDRYASVNNMDSAIYYAKTAIEQIKDTNNAYNYLLFQNVANIAEKKQDFVHANDYRKQVFSMYEQSMRKRLDTQIIELEKKYDLSEAENTILRSQQNLLIITTIALALLLVLGGIVLVSTRVRKRISIQLLNAEHEVKTQAFKAELLTKEAIKRAWLNDLYGYVSDRLTSLQEQFSALSQRFVSSQPKIYDAMEKILHETDTDLHDIPKTLIPDDGTFYSYTNLIDEDNILNANEKMILMLLACKASNKQIATFMNTSLESIRVRKSQLKKKMLEKGMDVSLFV